MSNAQHVRDLLRRAGAPMTSAEIRESLDIDLTPIQMGGVLSALENAGAVQVDRDARPFTYVLIGKGDEPASATDGRTEALAAESSRSSEEPAPITESAAERQPQPTAVDKTPKAKPARQAAPASPAVSHDHEWSDRVRDAQPPVMTLPKQQVIALAALALRTSVPLSSAELREISELIREAAAA